MYHSPEVKGLTLMAGAVLFRRVKERKCFEHDCQLSRAVQVSSADSWPSNQFTGSGMQAFPKFSPLITHTR